jgi:gas vesicle protein
MTDNNSENKQSACTGSSGHFGQKLMYLMIGSGIGAAIALLFAPKRGSELRGDITDTAAKRYEETLATANHLKRRTTEYYEAAKETGSEVLDVVVAGTSAVKEEISKDVERIGAIVEESAKRVVRSAGQSM